MSLIDLGVSLAVANSATKAFAGTSLIKFATEGWLTNTSGHTLSGSGSSWTFSAKELVMGVLDPSSQFGMTNTFANQVGGGLSGAIKKNFKEHGAMAIGTAIVAPLLGRLGKRLLRGQIRDANKLLKVSGVSQALGVKV